MQIALLVDNSRAAEQYIPARALSARITRVVVYLVLGAVFSTIGGLLGAMLFAKKMPPGAIDVPPPA